MHLKLLIVVFLGSLSLSESCNKHSKLEEKENKRVVNGHDARIEDFPFQLQMQLRQGDKWSFQCGAVIIGKDTVLTAAHCVHHVAGDPKKDFRFLAGSASKGNGTVHNVKHLLAHENYGRSGVDDDIVVAQVTPPFQFSATTKSIEIAEKEPTDGVKVTVSGFGLYKAFGSPYDRNSYPNTLQKGEMKIIDRNACDQTFRNRRQAGIDEKMICALDKKERICYGDSGGPCVADGKLVGLASFGITCNSADHPSVFTNVAYYIPWIKKNIEKWEK